MYELLQNIAILSIQGSNADKFLQRFTTNDIENKEFSYNYFLDSKGRYLFDSFIYKMNKEFFLLQTHSSILQELIDHLNFYKLKEQIILTDLSSEYALLYSNNEILDNNIIYSLKDPRHIMLGYRTLIWSKDIGSFDINSSVSRYKDDKYKLSITDGFTDLISKKSIVLEYGALELHAIHKNKGCYLGQELISRVLSQGIVRKKIYKLTSEQNLAKSLIQDHSLTINNIRVGQICSYYKNFAIAIINIEKIPFDNIYEFKIQSDDLEFECLMASWYQKEK